MRFTIIAFCMCLILQTGQAQNNFFTVITCKGHVVHKDSLDNELVLIPGSKIDAKGKLVIKEEGGMVKVISSDRPQKLQTPGEYDLEELYKSGDSKSMSFTGKFWKYLMEGLSSSNNGKDLKKYSETLAAGGIKGYNEGANNNFNIKSPVIGNIASMPLIFEWEEMEGCSEKYILTITDSNKNEIYKQETSKSSAQISEEDLTLENSTYYWTVKCGEKASSNISFTFDRTAKLDLNRKLSRISDYIEGDETEKNWIAAVVYDMEGHHYEAGLKFKALLKDMPDDLLLNKLYALHLTRIGRLSEAIELLE